MLRILMSLSALITLAGFAANSQADDFEPLLVGISPTQESVPVLHRGETIWVQREQDQTNTIDPAFALTSRPCPSFCIQPMTLAPGVDTLGELEMLDYLSRLGQTPDMLVVDSRSTPEFAAGAIPGAINVPWTNLAESVGAVDFTIEEHLHDFGVRGRLGSFDFSNAKTLVLYCNGPWCGQSPSNIRTLLRLGYPPEKLKWYRGGMQAWRGFGFPIIDLH